MIFSIITLDLQFNGGDIDDESSSGDDDTEDDETEHKQHRLNTISEQAVDLSSLTLKDKVLPLLLSPRSEYFHTHVEQLMVFCSNISWIV